MSTNSDYIDAQLFTVAPLPLENDNYPYGFDIQIVLLVGRRIS